MAKLNVKLISRKRRPTGNFSIETSFDVMQRAFPAASELALQSFTSSHYSDGISARLRGLFEMRSVTADLYHVTGDVHYLTLALPAARTILTIHDCGFMSQRTRLPVRVKKWVWLDWPVAHCAAITAVSAATKADIVRYSGCNPAKITVIPTVVNPLFTAAPKPFNSACPRILHIGLAPNKNFERHVAALESMNCELHVIGQIEPQHEALLRRHRVRYTASYNLSETQMQQAYLDCDIVLFASTLEGFGMPIVEAQATGRVVITGNRSAMPDTAGGGACLVDSYSTAKIRAAVTRVCADAFYRETLIERGFANAKRFDAHSVARQYEQLYRNVHAAAHGVPRPATAHASKPSA